MTIAQIISLLEATSLSDTPDLEHTIESVCGSDMMSDCLSGLCTGQTTSAGDAADG